MVAIEQRAALIMRTKSRPPPAQPPAPRLISNYQDLRLLPGLGTTRIAVAGGFRKRSTYGIAGPPERDDVSMTALCRLYDHQRGELWCQRPMRRDACV
jgi:hypothetical protein